MVTARTPFVLTLVYLLIPIWLLWVTNLTSSSYGLPTLMVPLLSLIGVLISAAGFVIRYSGLRRIFNTNKGFQPWHTPEHLITDGVYKTSRNPAYLGAVLMWFGVFLVDINLLMGVVVIIAFALFNLMAGREEKVLAKKFGETYTVYKSKTRRWL